MKKAHYDQTHASKLVPLLESIGREIVERRHAIEVLEFRVERFARSRRMRDARPGEAEAAQAALASHRRDLRLALTELERLGCQLDSDHPLRVLIPGAAGRFEDGYAWESGKDVVRSQGVDVA